MMLFLVPHNQPFMASSKKISYSSWFPTNNTSQAPVPWSPSGPSGPSGNMDAGPHELQSFQAVGPKQLDILNTLGFKWCGTNHLAKDRATSGISASHVPATFVLLDTPSWTHGYQRYHGSYSSPIQIRFLGIFAWHSRSSEISTRSPGHNIMEMKQTNGLKGCGVNFNQGPTKIHMAEPMTAEILYVWLHNHT